MDGKEAKAEDEAHRAPDAAGADPDHHPRYIRCRQGARAPYCRRHLGPPKGSTCKSPLASPRSYKDSPFTFRDDLVVFSLV